MLSVDWGEQSVLPARTRLALHRGLGPASSAERSPIPGIENVHISANIIAQKSLELGFTSFHLIGGFLICISS